MQSNLSNSHRLTGRPAQVQEPRKTAQTTVHGNGIQAIRRRNILKSSGPHKLLPIRVFLWGLGSNAKSNQEKCL